MLLVSDRARRMKTGNTSEITQDLLWPIKKI